MTVTSYPLQGCGGMARLLLLRQIKYVNYYCIFRGHCTRQTSCRVENIPLICLFNICSYRLCVVYCLPVLSVLPRTVICTDTGSGFKSGPFNDRANNHAASSRIMTRQRVKHHLWNFREFWCKNESVTQFFRSVPVPDFKSGPSIVGATNHAPSSQFMTRTRVEHHLRKSGTFRSKTAWVMAFFRFFSNIVFDPVFVYVFFLYISGLLV